MQSPGRRSARVFVAVRAVLALGIVLGVGAAGTAAQWTDQEYGTGTFTTGTLAIQSSADGTAFTDHPAGAAAALTFNASAMYPGLSVAAPFVVRATAGSLGGTLALSTPVTSGNATLLSTLTYKVYTDTTSGCTPTSTPSGTGAWIAGTATTSLTGLTAATPQNTQTLPAATATAPGGPVFYCLIVQLPTTAPNSVQGVTATATWSVTATGPTP
jgi:predicted ribosomally synthesized peptide with SipW-like signal peptide